MQDERMLDERIRLLETSFAEIAEICDQAAGLFCERLFANDPSLRRLFGRAELREPQGRTLMTALGVVIEGQRWPELVEPVLEKLALALRERGLEDGHYGTIRTALMETLALSFGERFTPELRAAWSEAYGAASAVMRRTAARPAAQMALA